MREHVETLINEFHREVVKGEESRHPFFDILRGIAEHRSIANKQWLDIIADDKDVPPTLELVETDLNIYFDHARRIRRELPPRSSYRF